jgi:tetratricopeptide (TPR) repeat protein
MRATIVIASIVWLLFAPSMLRAQSTLDGSWKGCQSSDADKRLVTCTAIINANGFGSTSRLAEALDGRCWAYNTKAQFALAVADCKTAIALRPNYFYAYNNLGTAYLGVNDYASALDALNKAIILKPDFFWSRVNRAKAYAAINNTEAAITDYEYALILDPNNEEIKHALNDLRTNSISIAQSPQPSFDCSKATTRIENIICSDPELAEWDASLGQAYKQAYARLVGNDRQGLIKDQRQWISSRNAQRDQSGLAETKACIIQFTKSRLAALAQLGGALPSWMSGVSTDRGVGGAQTSNNAEGIPLVAQGGTFVIPVQINGQITLNFTIDSGAAEVSIPADVVSTLIRTGTIQKSDFIGQKTYRLADGSTVPSATFVIRSLRVGNRLLENVTGSIASADADLLLGQSFLSRFNSWSIDNKRQVLLLN